MAERMLESAPGLKTYKLRFFFGDLRLFTVEFRAHIERAPFDPSAQAGISVSKKADFPRGAEVVVRLSEPVSDIGPPLAFTRWGLRYLRNRQPTHFFELTGTFEDYVKGFSSKVRSNIQRRSRKLEALAQGTLECRSYARRDTVDEFYQFARRVAARSYQERLLGIAIPDTDEFVEGLRQRAQNDTFRGYVLLVKDQPVAYEYYAVEHDTVDAIYTGYDPNYAEGSPGIVLLYKAIERLFAERRFRYFDLGYGDGQRKKDFGRREFLRADVVYVPWHTRPVIFVLAHFALDRVSRWSGFLLQHLGVRQRVRRLLRLRYAP
jgi:hypothetical protein